MGVGVGVIVWMGAVVIAWVKKGVCGLDSLDCCCKVYVHECVCVCRERQWERRECVGVIVWVGVGVIAWVRKGMCGWDSRHNVYV